MQKSEKFTPSQIEFHSYKSEISLLWEWYLTHFTLSRVKISLFQESEHSNHSISSDFFYVYWNLNLFISRKRERVVWVVTLKRVKIHSLKSEMGDISFL